jgi:hypothetical protein
MVQAKTGRVSRVAYRASMRRIGRWRPFELLQLRLQPRQYCRRHAELPTEDPKQPPITASPITHRWFKAASSYTPRISG